MLFSVTSATLQSKHAAETGDGCQECPPFPVALFSDSQFQLVLSQSGAREMPQLSSIGWKLWLQGLTLLGSSSPVSPLAGSTRTVCHTGFEKRFPEGGWGSRVFAAVIRICSPCFHQCLCLLEPF